MWKIKLQKIEGNLSDNYASKIVQEWNGHLEIFSLLQVLEILGNTCFFEQIFYRKQSLGAAQIVETFEPVGEIL